jgi:hypothetical protein
MHDSPRMFADPAQIELRRKQLDEPHIVELATFAKSLDGGDLGKIPDFDPWDGGKQARILFLVEKPGPKSFKSSTTARPRGLWAGWRDRCVIVTSEA